MRTLVLGAVAACAVLACTACGSHPAPSGSPSPQPVIATTAHVATLRPNLQLAGIIAPYRQFAIAADLNEPFTDVDVQEGDQVRAGQVLARQLVDDIEAQLASGERMEAEDIARYDQTAYQTGAVNAQDVAAVNSAIASLRQAQVNLAGARKDLQRYANLAAQGYVAQETLDEQRVTVSTDEQAVLAARASLNQAVANERANGSGSGAGEQQQELEQAREAADAAAASVVQLQREIARATLVAPANGVVEAVNVNPGEYPSGRELFTIEDIDTVYAVLPASSTQVLGLRMGAPATVQATGGGMKFTGKVVAILDQIEPGTTNFTVKVLLQNPQHALHSGIPVTAQVAQPPIRGVVIPIAAFVDDTRTSVYAVSNGQVHEQTVAEVQDDGTNAVVTGLPAGTTVVKDVSSSNVGNGDEVKATT